MLLTLWTIVRRGGVRGNRALTAPAVGILILFVVFGPAYNLNAFGMNHWYSFQYLLSSWGPSSSIPSAAVRKYDRFLNDLDSQHTLDVTPALYVNACLVAWQYPLAEGWVHIGSGAGGLDLRYRGMFQKTRYPAWHVYFPTVIKAATFAGGRLLVKEFNDPVTRLDHTWVVPLDTSVGCGLAAARRGRVRWVDYGDVRGRVRDVMVRGYPRVGVFEVDTFLAPPTPRDPVPKIWSVLPLTREDALRTGAQPARVGIDEGYPPFLGSVCGQYQLLLVPR